MRLAEVILFEDDRYEPQQITGTWLPKDRLDNDEVTEWAREHRIIIGRLLSLHCEPWIREAQGHLTFRGTDRTNNRPAFTRRVRDDRKPRDSGPEENQLFEFFLEAAGSSARRHNSLYVTGREDYADSYGFPHVVYPMGNFSYTWLPGVSDWGILANMMAHPPSRQWIVPERMAQTQWFQHLTQHSMSEFPKSWETILHEEGPITLAKVMIRDGRRHPSIKITDSAIYDTERIRQDVKVDQGLPEALKTGAEIMVRCNQALYLHPLVQQELDKNP